MRPAALALSTLIAGLASGCYYPTDGMAPPTPDTGVDVTVQKCSAGQKEGGVDATLSNEASQPSGTCPDAAIDVPVFSLDAGTSWQSLYRDYFGPSGAASCAGIAGECHGQASALGSENSCTRTGCFLCPAGDASTACWQSMTSVGDGGANLVIPGQTFGSDQLSQILCSVEAGTFGMPQASVNVCLPPYCFTPVDWKRIADWVNAGAQNN